MVLECFYNEQAEKSVIALTASGKDNAALNELTADDFYDADHRKLFAAMQALYAEKKPVDLVNVTDQLGKAEPVESKRLGDKLVDYVTNELFGASWQIASHIEIIKGAAQRRQLYETLTDARKDLKDGENDTAAVVDKLRQELRDMASPSGHTWRSMPDVLLAAEDAIERRQKGTEPIMPSGISTLDTFTTGFHKGEMTIIGARPAVGKSALGMHIALGAAKAGYSIGVCSREMTDVQYGTRIIMRDTSFDPAKLRTGQLAETDWEEVVEAMTHYSACKGSFMFTTRYIEDLRSEVQKKVDTDGLDMLVVDYIQLLQSKRRFQEDYLRIAYVSKTLKDMTVDLNIAIIALAQVGRSSEGSMPTLSELRGSGDLEQDADNVIFMHRPENANDKAVKPDDRDMFGLLKENQQYIVLNVAKQRQGQIGMTSVIFEPERMRFLPIERRVS